MSDSVDDLLQQHLAEGREIPAGLAQKAKDLMPGASGPAAVCPHCGKAVTPFKKSSSSASRNALWLAAGAAAFALSFYVRPYFMQCLAVALFCAVKWAIERRALKTRILLYKALSEGEGAEASRLHRHASRL